MPSKSTTIALAFQIASAFGSMTPSMMSLMVAVGLNSGPVSTGSAAGAQARTIDAEAPINKNKMYCLISNPFGA